MNVIKDTMQKESGIYNQNITAFEGKVNGHFVAYRLEHPEWSVPDEVRVPWLHPYNSYPMPMAEAYYMNKLIHEFAKDNISTIRRLALIINTKITKYFSTKDKSLYRDFCKFLNQHPDIEWSKCF